MELAATVTSTASGLTSAASGSVCVDLTCYGEGAQGVAKCGTLDPASCAPSPHEFCGCSAEGKSGIKMTLLPELGPNGGRRVVLTGPILPDGLSCRWNLDGKNCGDGAGTTCTPSSGNCARYDVRLFELPTKYAGMSGEPVLPGAHELWVYNEKPAEPCDTEPLVKLLFTL